MNRISLAGLVALVSFSLAPLASAQNEGTGFFRTEGREILNREGEPVVMRGVGLGGWLMPEGYMLRTPGFGSPTTIRQQVADVLGEEDAAEFWRRYRANYVAEEDIAAIAEWGYDHVRLAFHYDVLYDISTEELKEDGFELFDTFIEWCRANDLDVVLDMHAAPGGQNHGNISDSDGTARFWTEPEAHQPHAIAIWEEIARRYKDEPLIIGYDILNEPVLPDGVTAGELRDFYERAVAAIRAIDTNHIVFIEGDWYATNFTGLTPPFDDNMVYAFHRYWDPPVRSTIQNVLDMREEHNVPVWLGESGENSNPWFFAMTRLLEENGIGWNWWMHKKIETTSSPCSIPFAEGYETVLEYWRGNRSKPSQTYARNALFGMADNLSFENCVLRQGVLAALFDPEFGTTPRPFKEHTVPGIINAADYNLGNQGVAYSDADYQTISGTPGSGNAGGQYRNDGVDIETSSDPEGYEYSVGWISPLEWLSYTVDVESAGTYDVEFRVASEPGGGQFSLQLNDVTIGERVHVPPTGGWQSWSSVRMDGIELPEGQHVLKVLFRNGDLNFNRMIFSRSGGTSSTEPGGSAAGPKLLGHYPNPVVDEATLLFESELPVQARLDVYDVLGRSVQDGADERFGSGHNRMIYRPMLAAGTYFYRLWLDDGRVSRQFGGSFVMAP